MKVDKPPSLLPSGMPETPVARWVQPFVRFFRIQSASGFLLLRSYKSPPKDRRKALTQVVKVAREGTSPLERLEFALHRWVAFLITHFGAIAPPQAIACCLFAPRRID